MFEASQSTRQIDHAIVCLAPFVLVSCLETASMGASDHSDRTDIQEAPRMSRFDRSFFRSCISTDEWKM